MQRGQATVEYTTLLGLVAALLAVAAVVAGTTSLGDPLVDAIRRALCVLGADTCPEAEPCVVARTSTIERASVTIGLVRVGADALLVRERRSDGSFAITVLDGVEGGGEAALGAAVELGRSGLGAEARGAVLAHGARGRTWIVPDARAADRLTRRLGDGGSTLVDAAGRTAGDMLGHGAALPRPALTTVALDEGVEARADGRAGPLRVDATAVVKGSETLVRDERTGRETILLGMRGALAGAVSAKLLGVEAAGEPVVLVSLVRDGDGRPLELGVSATATAEGRGDVPGPVASLLDRLGVPQRTGALVEVGGRVDLTTDRARAVLRRVLHAAGSPGELRAVGEALADLVAEEAQLHARAYTLSRDETRVGGRIAFGPGLGARGGRVTDVARLAAAAVRAPGTESWKRLAC